jgi:MFS family permease
MFGWASLVPVLLDESLNAITVNGNNGYTPTDLSQIFTASAVGNYLATLPFGLLLDYYGPKTTGIVGSILYGIGLILCGIDDSSYWLFFIGFGLIGASRPGIQLPTLHLANLFTTKEGSNAAGIGGGALYMSAQAAAFDAGTAVFACFHFLHFQFGWKSSMTFRYYLVVPLFTLLTAIFIWPNETLEKSISPPPPPPPIEEGERDTVIMPSTPPPTIGSPHWSPRERRSLSKSFSSSTSGK